MTTADLVALIRKQPVAFICGLVVLACAVTLFLRSDAVTAAQASFEAKDSESRKVEANARSAAGLAEVVEEMLDAGRQFDTRVVRASQLANNLQFFYRLESETNVKLLDVRQLAIPPLRPGEKRGAYAPVPFTVNIQGAYPQVYGFIRRIEASTAFIRINQMSVTKMVSSDGSIGATGDSVSVAMNIEMLGTP